MKNRNKIFEDLFVLDLANNHFGDFSHAKKIINSFSKITKKNKLKATIKFQFRDLNTFIHPSQLNNKNNKYVKRFSSTKMSFDNFTKLSKLIKSKDMLTSCTPFDENSVDVIEKMKFNFLKIASVSSNDWSLLERVRKNNIPKIISTGGKNLDQIDNIVSFFRRSNTPFSIMHCVAIYPSENYHLNLEFIKSLKKRYKDITIGWSTHERPENLLPSTIAYSCGARMFEKHIGISSKKYKLNDYSTTPKLFEKYISNLQDCKKTLGNSEKIISPLELKTLDMLDRGVYAKKDLTKGSLLKKKDVYFAFPKKPNQISPSLSASVMSKIIIKKSIKKDQPIMKNSTKVIDEKNYKLIIKYIHRVKAMLNYCKIDLGEDFDLEISHHYGIDKFLNYGCFLFNCVNRTYAKKIVVLFANQKHPLHKHKIKEETFQILYGKLYSELNGKLKILLPGDKVLVKPNVWHKFRTDGNGCIFEEISTTSVPDDSFYEDKKISSLKREERKTFVKRWGIDQLKLKYSLK